MMIDFMDRDDQEMIRIQEEFLAKAAQASSIRAIPRSLQAVWIEPYLSQ